MMEILSEYHLVALIGLLTGIPLGLAARLGRFCTLGAIEDALYGGSTVRLRMWGMAIGLAVLGSFGLMASGLLTDNSTYYLSIRWMPLASILGGLVFGYGMALSGMCGYGAIARLGGGDLRSFVIVLVMGVATFVVLSGPLAPLRALLFPQEAVTTDVPPGIAHQLAALSGLSVNLLGMAIGALILAGSAASRTVWEKPAQAAWAAAVGLAVVGAWAGTSWVARDGFEALPVVSHSFAAPLGDTILWWMTGSARPLSFAVGSVAGVWGGAFIGSLFKGHFRWEACEDPRELRRQIVGAALMGGGAVIALGCSIGQGLSAFSVLAISAPVTFAAIFAGAAFGLRQLIVGFQPAE
ncbi:YeeE/YedE family protein [Mameliella sediminis]|uniref:YeeE/YedE family protein n=1 Tax=Mameliella sediminis TaxID=2836866 RepID=UPI001C47CE71|nr:YeeE/YedE family protein [Mameliella sediminis]MBV7396339.1 YeeE/YedE family protein [Mameliella sediminis]MBY6160751.1 YeeE/YedE family protein [Mameliella alba]MBY6169221.1 YeeE/YedE family protein [Mameliella alba]MBY6173558.1 YeeE/YedE family protein [Mameliella alba]